MHLDADVDELDRLVDLASGGSEGQAGGRYLVYLQAWERHLTAIEEPSLGEAALGGPDTATRTGADWQVKLTAVKDDAECCDFDGGWTPDRAESRGRMRARTECDEAAADDGTAPAYRGLENRPYRIEVHTGGAPGAATFAWSRDNGCVMSRLIAGIEPAPGSGLPVLPVAGAGCESVGGFAGAKLIELCDEARVLAGEASVLVGVDNVVGCRITLEEPGINLAERFGPGAWVRRWDGSETLEAGCWTTLDDGVAVEFDAGNYVTGDYWTVPIRSATGDVEWPCADGEPVFESRHGSSRLYAPIALLDLGADGTLTFRDDCRPEVPPD